MMLFTYGRVVAYTAVAALFAVSSCGGEADSHTEGAATSAAVATLPADPPVGNGPKGQIREVIDDVQDALIAGDALGLCQEVSLRQQQRFSAIASRRNRSCDGGAAAIIENRRMDGIDTVRSRLISVRVRGGHAVAVVRDPDGAPYRVGFATQDGIWRLPLLDPDAASGLPRS